MPRQEHVDLEIGRRLAHARLRRGLSQGTVARLAGLDPSYISRIETGKVDPTWHTLNRVARALQTSMVEIAAESPVSEAARGPCPITTLGDCLMDRVRSESTVDRSLRDDTFTPRQVKILREFATWLRSVPPGGQHAVEILLAELARGGRRRDDA